MDLAQLVDHRFDDVWAAIAEQLGPHPKSPFAVAVRESPVAEGDHDWEHLDTGLGERVCGPLPAASLLAGEQPGCDKVLEPAGEDVGGDALLGTGDQFAEVATVAEHDVAQHEHRPRVAEHLDGDVDRATRPRMCVLHAMLRQVIALRYCIMYVRECGLADLLPQLDNTVWIGMSAGSMVATPRIGQEFVGWKPPIGGDRALGLVNFSIFPHLDHPNLPSNTMANAEKWAADLDCPSYAIDDHSAITVVDGTVNVISEGAWRHFDS